jgi:hypothetical protein
MAWAPLAPTLAGKSQTFAQPRIASHRFAPLRTAQPSLGSVLDQDGHPHPSTQLPAVWWAVLTTFASPGRATPRIATQRTAIVPDTIKPAKVRRFILSPRREKPSPHIHN